MVIIDEQTQLIKDTLGIQKIKENTVYRPLSYVRDVKAEEGRVLLNLLTGEMILVDEEEFSLFSKTADMENDTVKELIEKWFLVPEDTVDANISKQLVTVINAINNIYTAPKLTSFTILPTTDCNARCFYCYELGCEKKTMTEQTAMDIVDYIIAKKQDGEIKLRWFGGEPLYNSKVIDIICSELNKRGVKFYSNMISNAFLFDDEMMERAVDVWHLNRIQITIDGPEEQYNRIKAYINPNCESPFKKVIYNVEYLLKKNVNIAVRLNVDKHNVEQIFSLADFLLEKFSKYPNFFAYPNRIFDDTCKNMLKKTEDEEAELNDKIFELKVKFQNLLNYRAKYSRLIRFKNHCMADSDTSVMILPDGKLGKCEHFTDSNYIGSIYEDKLDFKMLNWFKQMTSVKPECDECDLRPACIYVKCCPAKRIRCNASEKAIKEKNLEGYILETYKIRKSGKNEIEI
ncbi:MAG: radical SAM protein [Clostridia bacterium]|nr:radical SAM protein [Clostridia bacterium]